MFLTLHKQTCSLEVLVKEYNKSLDLIYDGLFKIIQNDDWNTL